ncbi:beta-lactamase family protein [Bradyrhizobium sp. 83012]|uniref:Beta-lactamase family protein n=2 Tax=Bradyrhizobium aeschynomenes TaxID=2734909 RepID=A0ABX2CDV9_9BRAD|nr:beta-lactamase family protein [Bradyrhizobium aeschynomenes]
MQGPWCATLSSLLLAASLTIPAFAEGLPKVDRPENVGLSSERLQRLTHAFQADVDKGLIPGAVVLVARKGKVAYAKAFGFQDREKQVPMKLDAIFRVASMTKPFTSVAAMMLVEEGRLQLLDPVSVYLPEFKGLQVGVEKINQGTGQPELTLEPARREMTVQDLMRHTSGLTYGIFGKSLVKQAYNNANLFDPSQTSADLITKLAKLPLAAQPGTTWDYSMSTDVLGRIVEVVSGQRLDQFIAERISKPLALTDTGFSVGGDKTARIAEPQADPTTGKRPPMPDMTRQPNWMSGGGGMVSTAADYAEFAQMLLNRGEWNGRHLLAAKTVTFMTSDHLPPGIAFSQVTLLGFHPQATAPTPEDGQSFGLGFAVRTHAGRNPLPGSVSEFYWTGLYGTAFWVDPEEKLIVVLMMQLPPPQAPHYRSLLRNLIYQALIE